MVVNSTSNKSYKKTIKTDHRKVYDNKTENNIGKYNLKNTENKLSLLILLWILDKVIMCDDIPDKFFGELNIIYKQIEKIKETM